MKSQWLVVLCMVGLGSPSVAMDQASAIKKAIAFAQTLDPPLPSSEFTGASASQIRSHSPSAIRWIVVAPRYLLTIDDATGRILSCSYAGPPDSNPGSMRRGRAFYRSEADLISKVARKLDRLGWAHGPEFSNRDLPHPDSTGLIGHAEITIRFNDRPNGYPTYGNGNFANITVDAITGNVTQLERGIGYRYEPPRVVLSPAQARNRAAKKFKVEASAKVGGPSYVCLSDQWHPSPRATSLIREKRVPLAYVVQCATENVVVAVDTGEILVHYANATGSAKSHRKRM